MLGDPRDEPVAFLRARTSRLKRFFGLLAFSDAVLRMEAERRGIGSDGTLSCPEDDGKDKGTGVVEDEAVGPIARVE